MNQNKPRVEIEANNKMRKERELHVKEGITTLSMRVNDKCNFRCKYCFSHLDHPENKEMSFEMADNILKWCKQNGIKSVNIPQKEPMQSWKVLKYIIETYTANGVAVKGITTNGSNMPLDAIKTFKKYNMHLLCSYDGVWQDETRIFANGKGTSSIVEKNLYALKGAGVNFGIACAITKNNTKRILENYMYLKEINPGIAFNFDTTSPLSITMKELPDIKKAFKVLINETLDIFPVNKIYNRMKQNSTYTNFMCGAGRGSYTIDWDGTFYPCYHAPAWKDMGISIGNIRDGVDWEEKAKFRKYDTKTPDKCKKCPTGLCGICYVNSYDAMGDMLMPIPVNCEIFRILTALIKKRVKDNPPKSKQAVGLQAK